MEAGDREWGQEDQGTGSGSASVFYKGPESQVLGFTGHVHTCCVTATQLSHAHNQSDQMRAGEWRALGGMAPQNKRKRKKKEVVEYARRFLVFLQNLRIK